MLKKSEIFLLVYLFLTNGLSKICALEKNLESKIDPKYGYSQSDEFINAMYGTSPAITEELLQKITNTIPADNNNKSFFRLGVNNGTSYLTQIKNISINPGINSGLVAITDGSDLKKLGGEIAIGYKWDKLFLELEFMITENMKYNSKNLFSNLNGSLDSTVKARSILLNSNYDFINLKSFRMFAGLGLGAGINITNSKFFNNQLFASGENFTRRTIAGGYNLLLGCKLSIVPQLFIIASLRYTNFGSLKKTSKKKNTNNTTYMSLGKLEWSDKIKNLHLEGQHSLTGISISLMHVFI